MALRHRFVIVLAAYGVALASVLGFVSWRISRVALEAELDRRLTDVAGVTAAVGMRADVLLSLEPGFEDLDVYAIHQTRLRGLLPFVDRAFAFNIEDRRLLVSSDAAPIGTDLYELEPFWDEIFEAFTSGRSTTRHFALEGRPYKYGFVRLEPGEPVILGVLIPADFLDPIGRLRAALLWSSAGALLVAVLLGGLLAASVVSPLEQLARAALRIQRGRLDRPVEAESAGEDEVARLARAMERMREAILERDDRLRLMLAQVAHELRNPLGGLELFASAAASAEDPSERRRLIDRVRSEVAALNLIIDDFLTFARPLEPRYEPVDLRSAVEEAGDLARAELPRNGRLEVCLPPEPLLARADREQVKRAVLNLLRNAAQSGTRVRVWAEQDGGDVMIAVLDDGPGVSDAVRDRIFDPFVSDKQKGAGLGLAIVKKIAEAHGGRVEVRQASDPAFGSGAEFRLYLSGSREPSSLVPPAPTTRQSAVAYSAG